MGTCSPMTKKRKRQEANVKDLLFKLRQTHECPITQSLFVDPCIAADGNTYERESIERWFKHHSQSPVTNQVLSNKTLFPATTVRQAVSELVNKADEDLISQETAAAWHLASGIFVLSNVRS